MQCNHINKQKYEELLPKLGEEQALEQSRCTDKAKEGYSRCEKHGGGTIIEFYSRGLKEDECIRLKALYEDMIEKYEIPEDNQFLINLTAATARQLVSSHNASLEDIQKCISQAIRIGNELAITPKERKRTEININLPPPEVQEKVKDIQAIVSERMKLVSSEDELELDTERK